jgi:N-acetylmuramoyl-L-alanine amidase
MNIINSGFSWNGNLSKRTATDFIIIHHRAGNGDAPSIHHQHLKNGWVGIGYHFYIRKDGNIFSGRPLDTVGAHTVGKNAVSVGICFEGNYDSADKEMPAPQLKAGKELITYLKGIYKNASVKRHSDFQPTACPGKVFPFDKIVNSDAQLLKNADEITWELNHNYFKIDDYEGFIRALDKEKSENSPMYWGYYKLVNHLSPAKK